MATINGLSGSPLFGSPINVNITSASPAGDITFHEVRLCVTARLQNGTDRDYTFAKPVGNGTAVQIDISTALLGAFEPYVYTATPPEYYPYVVFTIQAWDEYVLNGELHTTEKVGYGGSMRALAGAYSDLERLLAGEGKSTLRFTRKPATLPEVVMVGETHIRPADMSATVSNISHGQQPLVTVVSAEGLQTVNGVLVYALPAGQRDRYEFRFINGLGCMESLSVSCLRSAETSIQQEQQVISRHETFGTFSRGFVRKQSDHEQWRMTSGPVDEAWQSWFIHEFLMTGHAWLNVGGHWLPVHVLPEETVSGINRQDASLLSVDFTIQFDITGSLLSALAV